MVIFLLGPDSYRKTQRLNTLVDAFKKKFDPQGLNIEKFDGSNVEIADIQNAVASGGLFSEKRFVAISDMLSRDEDFQETVVEILENASDDAIIVVSADQLPQKKSALKTWLQKNAKTEKFQPLTIPEAQKMVTDETQRIGSSIEPSVAHTLAQRLHENTWKLMLTTKALAYEVANEPSRSISAERVAETLGEVAEENFFGLTDAIGSKQLERALLLLQKHIQDGAAIQMLISILGKHLTTLRTVLSVDARADIPGMHPYVLQKARSQATRFSLQELGEAHTALLQLDADIKSGNAPDPATRLHMIVADLCAANVAS